MALLFKVVRENLKNRFLINSYINDYVHLICLALKQRFDNLLIQIVIRRYLPFFRVLNLKFMKLRNPHLLCISQHSEISRENADKLLLS